MNAHDYFPKDCVCTLTSSEKYQAIGEMIDKLPPFQCIYKRKDFEEDVKKRELKQSTGLGCGVAIAHGNSCNGSIKIGLGIAYKGIEYNAIDHKPVRLLFMIATPPHKEQEYLLVLSALVKLLRKHDFRTSLLKMSTKKKIEGFIKQAFVAQLAQETC